MEVNDSNLKSQLYSINGLPQNIKSFNINSISDLDVKTINSQSCQTISPEDIKPNLTIQHSKDTIESISGKMASEQTPVQSTQSVNSGGGMVNYNVKNNGTFDISLISKPDVVQAPSEKTITPQTMKGNLQPTPLDKIDVLDQYKGSTELFYSTDPVPLRDKSPIISSKSSPLDLDLRQFYELGRAPSVILQTPGELSRDSNLATTSHLDRGVKATTEIIFR